jgi:hypothetical protein
MHPAPLAFTRAASLSASPLRERRAPVADWRDARRLDPIRITRRVPQHSLRSEIRSALSGIHCRTRRLRVDPARGHRDPEQRVAARTNHRVDPELPLFLPRSVARGARADAAPDAAVQHALRARARRRIRGDRAAAPRVVRARGGSAPARQVAQRSRRQRSSRPRRRSRPPSGKTGRRVRSQPPPADASQVESVYADLATAGPRLKRELRTESLFSPQPFRALVVMASRSALREVASALR